MKSVNSARSSDERWGLGRPLRMKELGMILRLRGPDPGRAVSRWESGARAQSGPYDLALELLRDGAKPECVDRLLGL